MKLNGSGNLGTHKLTGATVVSVALTDISYIGGTHQYQLCQQHSDSSYASITQISTTGVALTDSSYISSTQASSVLSHQLHQ